MQLSVPNAVLIRTRLANWGAVMGVCQREVVQWGRLATDGMT
jgi:hypothetical protein